MNTDGNKSFGTLRPHTQQWAILRGSIHEDISPYPCESVFIRGLNCIVLAKPERCDWINHETHETHENGGRKRVCL